MIDRSPSQRLWCLKPGFIGIAGAASVALFLALPLASLIIFVCGALAYFGCWLALGVLFLAGACALLVGAILLVGGLSDGGPKAVGAGLALGALGAFDLSLHDRWNCPVFAAGETALEYGATVAKFLSLNVFAGYGLYYWSWSAMMIAIAFAAPSRAAICVSSCERPINAAWRGIHYTCPACHQRDTPHFRCPHCAAPASDLGPSPYGLLHAQCGSCGASLPTLDCLGRRALKKVCRQCSAELAHPAIGRQREIHFAIVGAPSSGKTALLAASVWQLAQQVAPQNGLQVEFSDDSQKNKLHRVVRGLARGARPAKTASLPHPRALNVALRAVVDDSGCLIYLYDAAGEDLTDPSRMVGHRFHQFADGMLLVIDPIAEALAGHGTIPPSAGGEFGGVNPASGDAASVWHPLVSRLEQRMNVSAEGIFRTPIAVVVSKVGALLTTSLASAIAGSPRIAALNALRPRWAAMAADGQQPSAVVRELLLDLGLANLVLGLETRFNKVAYFATSAIEELSSQHRQFALPRAALPLLWLIHQTGALRVAKYSIAARRPQSSPPTLQRVANDDRRNP